MSAIHPLISPEALAHLAQSSGDRLRIVDCSHDLGQSALGRQQYEQRRPPGFSSTGLWSPGVNLTGFA